jgi:DNA-binding CsgD family transcriptional regulator
VPLLVIFTYGCLFFFPGLAGKKIPAIVIYVSTVFWALFFIGFVLAEFRFFQSGDRLLVNLLNPVFDWGIIVWGFFGIVYAAVYSRWLSKKAKLAVQPVLSYYFLSFVLFSILNTNHFPIHIEADRLTRNLLGLVLHIPPLIWLLLRLRTIPAGPGLKPARQALPDQWLEKQNISPREKEILVLLLDGKNSRTIEKELFISRRTVESHIYNIYKKLHVKNRLQLIRILNDKASVIK